MAEIRTPHGLVVCTTHDSPKGIVLEIRHGKNSDDILFSEFTDQVYRKTLPRTKHKPIGK